MDWKTHLPHTLSIAYWAIAKEEPDKVILADPVIENLSFFNPEISAKPTALACLFLLGLAKQV